MLERWEISGINRKLQLKPLEFEDDPDVPGVKRVSKLLLVLKWGGELTKLGEKQAMALGHSFRESLYPGVGSEVSGGGLLRLHSTFRHDLKIKTSDEVRKNATPRCMGFRHVMFFLLLTYVKSIAADQPVSYMCRVVL